MKKEIKHATAIYTGGGLYIYYGQLTDGNYFRAYDEWECIEICNSDTSVEDADYSEFYEEHSVGRLEKEEYKVFWNEMLLWIINNKPKGNYQACDLENRMIKEKKNMAKLEMQLKENTVDELIEVLEKYRGKKITIMGSCEPILVYTENEYVILEEINLEEEY